MNSLRAIFPTFIKRLVWNYKYSLGKYPQLDAPEDAVAVLAKLPSQGHILDLGCGRSSLLRGLRAAGWNGQYCGVDISTNAIRCAAGQFQDQNSSWIASDIETFDSAQKWDAVIMIESFYYIQIEKVEKVLAHAVGMLASNGYILIRLHNFEKHRVHVNTVNQLYSHTEQLGSLLIVR